jgi:hypothetical protein
MNLEETGLASMDLIALAQDGNQWKALVNMVMNYQFP